MNTEQIIDSKPEPTRNGTFVESYREVKSILVSQPKPADKSPYYELEKKYNITIDWRSFIHVEPVPARDFRKFRIRIEDFSAIVLTSKNAVDHFFRMVEEMRVKLSPDLKYFCLTEAIANYLQKFIVYRKRKVFVGNRGIDDLSQAIKRNKSEKFLIPCSNLGAKDVCKYLDENELNWQEATMFNTVSSDLSDLSDVTYDILVFFSPQGIESLYDNFPDFKQNNTRIAVFGNSTRRAVEERNLRVNIQAPTEISPSMTAALEQYLQKSNHSVG
jgi:uroporphyrinogen-III synthase